MMQENFLSSRLDKRRAQNAFRQLQLSGGKIDFCSNDYLGLARDKDFSQLVAQRVKEQNLSHGSTGSRLLAGNYLLIEETEKQIAAFHQAEAGLIFNSGYDANIGLFSSLLQKGDVVIYDQLVHASIHDGIRLSHAQSFSFLHNDINDLEKKLQHATILNAENIFIAIESVYSMDGDIAPLKEIVGECEKYNAHIIIDEAHATGVIGKNGEGLAQHLQLQNKIFARVHTFGKALGAHGAIILGSQNLRDYLINFARSFIFTTALPPAAVAAIGLSYEIFPRLHERRNHLQKLIELFQKNHFAYTLLTGETPIQILLIPGNEKVKATAASLQKQGLDVRAILHPTVARGQERLRIVLHSFNTVEEVEKLMRLLS